MPTITPDIACHTEYHIMQSKIYTNKNGVHKIPMHSIQGHFLRPVKIHVRICKPLKAKVF